MKEENHRRIKGGRKNMNALDQGFSTFSKPRATFTPDYQLVCCKDVNDNNVIPIY
jgi:hypothetical protein